MADDPAPSFPIPVLSGTRSPRLRAVPFLHYISLLALCTSISAGLFTLSFSLAALQCSPASHLPSNHCLLFTTLLFYVTGLFALRLPETHHSHRLANIVYFITAVC
ncbi:hypothetical protein V8E36_002205 [Tilletia maclaganii]